jgi:AcrR family transcriptional regulator
MQVLDEKKRLKILSAAAELFSAQPYHKVLLSDVAEMAGVGKGTLYVYFQNKEDLYLSVRMAGFSDLIGKLRGWIDEEYHSPVENLEAVVREIVDFAFQNPHHFQMMRTISGWQAMNHARWDSMRHELIRLIESVIRKGISLEIFEDPHPELTARIIPGSIRSIVLDGVDTMDAATIRTHILRFLLSGMRKKGASQ